MPGLMPKSMVYHVTRQTSSHPHHLPLSLGISNAEFVCGKAEDVISDLRLPLAGRGKVIGILDPSKSRPT